MRPTNWWPRTRRPDTKNRESWTRLARPCRPETGDRPRARLTLAVDVPASLDSNLRTAPRGGPESDRAHRHRMNRSVSRKLSSLFVQRYVTCRFHRAVADRLHTLGGLAHPLKAQTQKPAASHWRLDHQRVLADRAPAPRTGGPVERDQR